MNKNEEWFFTLRNRYTIGIIVIIAISVVFTFLQLRYLDRAFEKIAENRMIEEADIVLDLDIKDDDFLYNISNIESSQSLYIELYTSDGNLVYTTNTNYLVNGQDEADITEMKPREMKVNFHRENEDGTFFDERQEYYASAKYIVYEKSNDNMTAVLFYSQDILRHTSDSAQLILFGFNLWFLITAVLILSLYSLQVHKPIHKLQSVTKKLSEMDFSEKVPALRITDLNKLGHNINKMSESLEYHIESLRKKNQQLEYDIEKEKQSENVIRIFLANASHELKTPISIIQSYAEGIKYDDNHQLYEEYSDIIIDETDKMNNLIISLLNLVKYEYYKDFSLDMQRFCISDWVEEYLNDVSILFERNGITLEKDIEKDIYGYGDCVSLKQVLSNFVMNAVSHCDGEKIIRVSLKSGNDYSTVYVFNTGKHIDDDDMPFIWDSFYRADKAHSRAEGRFGLGLSIVRIIQYLHKSSCDAENVEDGVCFSFDINKKPVED